MKLLALHLTNVRRFTGKRASITGIGDGITVVSEANEFGKSTFFDAIHALFFEKYSSSAKPVKSLRPYAGGAVEVAADVQSEDGVFRVEKRFLSKAIARVSRIAEGRADVTVAQDDEAERWIAGLLGSALDGPAGLLWVRQGLVGLEPDSPKEKSQLVETRRDLLSSVAGEIDTMTGGRRMDRLMGRVLENLGAIATKTGKERGPWKSAVDDVTRLKIQLGEVEAQVATLGSSIEARKKTELALSRLNDTEANARRKTATELAQKAFEEAKAHDGKVAAARQNRDLAAVLTKTAKDELDRFLEALEALDAAQKQEQACVEEAGSAQDEAERIKELRDAAELAHQAANDAQKIARKSIDQARRQADATKAREIAKELAEQIEKAKEAKRRLDVANAKISASKATTDWLVHAEDAADNVAKARAAMAAQLTTLSANYEGAARIRVNGAELAADETVSLEGRTEIDLPGIGQLKIEAQNGIEGAKRKLAAQKAELDRLLAQAESGTIQDARKKVEATRRAMADAQLEAAMLETLAPDGIDALSSVLAEAELAATGADDAPNVVLVDLEASLSETEAEAARLGQELGARETDYAVAREKAVKAAVRSEGARQALERAETGCGPEGQRDETRAEMLRSHAKNETALKEAEIALHDLEAGAPIY